MTDAIIIYIPCNNLAEAQVIGKKVMEKRLSPCFNIIPQIESAAFWPPETGKIEKVNASVLLIKTLESKFTSIEVLVKKLHSDQNPCIIAIPIVKISKEYLEWMKGEVE